jgi:hypothetical protein
MGLSQKIDQLTANMQAGVKNSTSSLLGVVLKSISAFVLAFTLALITQVMIGFGTLSFVFVMVVFVTAFLRIMWKWSILQVILFDLTCILIAQLLRMYILMAP